MKRCSASIILRDTNQNYTIGSHLSDRQNPQSWTIGSDGKALGKPALTYGALATKICNFLEGEGNLPFQIQLHSSFDLAMPFLGLDSADPPPRVQRDYGQGYGCGRLETPTCPTRGDTMVHLSRGIWCNPATDIQIPTLGEDLQVIT